MVGKTVTTGYSYRQFEGGKTAAVTPIAYGCVDASVNILGGTGNFTVSHSTTGVYDISIAGEDYTEANCAVSVIANSAPNGPSSHYGSSKQIGNFLRLTLWGEAVANTQFQFIIYKTNPSVDN